MAVRNRSEVHGLDAEGLIETVRERVEGQLFSLVEFDEDEFNALFVPESTVAMYRDEAHMQSHFERIHDYVNLDYTELSLFTEDILPGGGEGRSITTTLENVKLVRVYAGRRGLFLAVGPDEPVVPLEQAARDALTEAA